MNDVDVSDKMMKMQQIYQSNRWKEKKTKKG